MKIEEVKERLKDYRDYYGWRLREYDSIDSAKTLDELKDIVDDHIRFVESASLDAESNLISLKRKLGLNATHK